MSKATCGCGAMTEDNGPGHREWVRDFLLRHLPHGKAVSDRKVQTYILATEPGISLRGAGWRKVAEVDGRQWKHTDGQPRRTDQPTGDKTRWETTFGLEAKCDHTTYDSCPRCSP